MSEARVAILYDAYQHDAENPNVPDILQAHPWNEERCNRGNIIERLNREYGIPVDILFTKQPDIPGNVQPPVVVAQNPEFYGNGQLKGNTVWEEGRLDDYSLVMDHAVLRFHYQPDPVNRPLYLQPQGIGLPFHACLNPYPIQRLSNKRETARHILEPHGLAIPTFTIDQLDLMAEAGADNGFVAKPASGSLSRGIRYLEDVDAVRAATNHKDPNQRIDQDHIIQVKVEPTAPIPDLKAYHRKDQSEINRVNNDRTHRKEVRNHVLIRTPKDGGEPRIEVYSTMRAVGYYGERQSRWFALDQERAANSTWQQDLGRTILRFVQDDYPNERVNCLVVFDEGRPVFPDGEARLAVVEANTRCPDRPREANACNKAFPGFLAEIALENAA